MPTESEIKAPYIETHGILEHQHYDLGLWTKEEFDQLHGENWDAMEAELIAEGYRKIPEPLRDLDAEVDEIKAKLKEAGII